MTLEEITAVTVEVLNPETPFGGVQVFGAGEDVIQVEWGPGIVTETPGVPTEPEIPGELPSSGATDRGITALVEGQDYIDVAFLSSQPDTEWLLVECHILNTSDPNPLNIWPGIITSKTTGGFRLQLNGMPDSTNYFLHWAIAGFIIEPFPATFYFLSGPESGAFDTASTAFTVFLPPGSTVEAPVVVTPDDAGAGGTFSPTSVTLTTASPSKTFTYTPASYGDKTISVTNDGTLSDPVPLIFSCLPPTYSFSGPTGGDTGTASTPFTVALSGPAAGTVTVTPSSGGGGGTFSPSSVALTTGSPSATFTYTPASPGAKTISVTNDGGLPDPDPLTYTVTAPAIGDGDPVSTWPDSSGNGNDATMTGSNRPIFKIAIVNGKPVVRFTVAGASKLNLTTPISGASPWIVFAVMKPAAAGSMLHSLVGDDGAAHPAGTLWHSTGNLFVIDRGRYVLHAVPSLAFHVFTGASSNAGVDDPAIFYDGGLQTVTSGAAVNTGSFAYIGWDGSGYSDGDIAEILIYNVYIAVGDFYNVCAYLGDKYGITVSGGGSVIDPSTVTGLVGWWKADAIT